MDFFCTVNAYWQEAQMLPIAACQNPFTRKHVIISRNLPSSALRLVGYPRISILKFTNQEKTPVYSYNSACWITNPQVPIRHTKQIIPL
jgi:hypothetical protein